MFGKIKKRNRMDNFEIPALRDVVKEGEEDVVDKFKKKFKEIKVKGRRKSVPSVMYSEHIPEKLPDTYYMETELEAIYMGTES